MTEKQGLTTAPRAALYARVSRDDQRTENQLPDLERLAKARGWKTELFVDHAVSGGKDRRPQLDRLMAGARAGKFDVVAVWKFDRFGRDPKHLIGALEEFRALHINFVSALEGIDTTTPGGELVFTIIAAIAKFERSMIGPRVKAGHARARAEGKVIGRPRRATDEKKALIMKLKGEGRSWRKIAMSVGLPRSTVRRAYREAKAAGLAKPSIPDQEQKPAGQKTRRKKAPQKGRKPRGRKRRG